MLLKSIRLLQRFFSYFHLHREEVAKKFGEKLLEYSSKGTSLKFIGYCLPDISFQNKQFADALYFQDATFYGKHTLLELE
jgi:hypothetical protein